MTKRAIKQCAGGRGRERERKDNNRDRDGGRKDDKK